MASFSYSRLLYSNLLATSIFIETPGIFYTIPKISPGAYIFQRPFLRGLFLEGLIFGGTYLQREICFKLEVNFLFLLCFNLYLRAIFQAQAPRGLIFGRAI